MPTALTATPEETLTKPTPRGTLTTRALFVAVAAALFGQPNAFFLYFPPYPILMLLVIVFLCGLILSNTMSRRPITLPRINLLLPTALFFVDSLFSLSYAPDPGYGVRILFSMLFKFLLFLAIVMACTRQEDLRKLLLIITILGGLFSLQGLLLIVGIVFFHLQPIGFVGSISITGDSTTNQLDLVSYGVFGFVKMAYNIGGITLARCQGMFLEPGWLATFLELSMFATLGWQALAKHRHQKLAYCLLGLQTLAFLLSFSSGGFIAIGGGMIVYIGLRLWSRPGVLSRRRLTRLVGTITGVCAVLVLLALLFPTLTEQVYQALYLTKVTGDSSSGADRLTKAADGLSLFWQRPIFGWGTNQSQIVNGGRDTGNALLTAAADLGVVGLAIYLAMIGAILWTAWTSLRLVHGLWLVERRGSDVAADLSAALVGCLTATLIHSMYVDTQWQFSYWISLALLYLNRRFLIRMS